MLREFLRFDVSALWVVAFLTGLVSVSTFEHLPLVGPLVVCLALSGMLQTHWARHDGRLKDHLVSIGLLATSAFAMLFAVLLVSLTDPQALARAIPAFGSAENATAGVLGTLVASLISVVSLSSMVIEPRVLDAELESD